MEIEDQEQDILLDQEAINTFISVKSVNGKTGTVVLTTSDLENTSDYQTGTQVESAINTAIAGKQDKLTAGDGISIEGNVISNTRTTVDWGNITGSIDNQTDLMNQFDSVEGEISDIQAVIPEQASPENKLADKAFVNSSISSSTANFIGTFDSLQELEDYSGPLTNNDYAFVVDTDAAGNTIYNRYKYNGSEWLFEYSINNSSFTAAQWDALNSGITDTKVAQITTNQNDIANLQTSKQNVINSNNKLNADYVDDTNTTNKFATSQQLSQISTNASDIVDLQSDKQDITDNSLATTSKTVPGAINEVNSIALGANQALSYQDYQTMVTDLNSAPDSAYRVGQNIYILTLNVPDLWVSSIEETASTYTYTTDAAFVSALETNGYVQVGYYKLSALETQEVDLTNYVTNTDYATSSVAGVVKVSNSYGTDIGSGIIRTKKATDYQLSSKANDYCPVVSSNLDYAVKIGVTTNENTLTDTEKTNACTWLGTGKMVTLTQAQYDALVSGGTVDADTYYFIPEE